MDYLQDSRPLLYMLLEGSPRLASFLNRYLVAILLGYFGLIVLANSFELSWLTHWFEIWSAPIDAVRKIFPIFDTVESELAAMRLSHRVGIIHHLLFAGWSIFAVAFIFCTAEVLRISRAEWMKIARVRSASKFATWSITMLLFIALGIFCVSIGITPTGNVSWDWYRYDPQLLWIAAPFYLALIAWVGALVTFIAAIFAHSSKTAGNDPTTAG